MKAGYRNKIMSSEDLVSLISVWKSEGKSIVFTNGCFDLLHLGHISYLEEAAGLGDHLIVGLNSQNSVSRLKGPSRPIQDEASRSAVLAGLSCVDAVCIFSEDTPLNLIELISPNVLVKGGDWLPEQIVGSTWVLHHGGIVRSLPFIPGYSTTQIVQKIKTLG